ncbi:glycoside hydrolase family 2 TIM barrel-domain containing protein [Bacteroidota bacterium]
MNYLRFSNIAALVLIAALSLFYSCNGKQESFFRNRDFNQDWIFLIADDENAAAMDIDESSWKAVDLPHDWSIEDYEIQNSLHVGPFFRNQPLGYDIGYVRTGTAWYRKYWETPRKLENKQVILHFDGVQTQSEVWINGTFVEEHVYGYTPFNVNITPMLNPEGKENLIAVKTTNTGENSRWMAGSGIYRDVSISIINPIAIDDWGLFVTTPDVNNKIATVEMEVRINNKSKVPVEIYPLAEITSPAQEKLTFTGSHVSIEGGSQQTIRIQGSIENPSLWDTENPELYTAILSLSVDGSVVDRYTENFGIRSISYSVEEGFLLNGKEILMKGACLHHDNGILGAAAFRDAEFRRVRIMKENGFNAIRTSHNPPSKHFLDACDELGMLVIDETFDHWMVPKRPKDYSNYFQEWYKKDIQSMVLRDRNHPSIVLWSFGNEVPERANPEGIETGKKLIAAIREKDSTRPITQAICDFWDNPGKEWDYSAGAFEILDISGYNYMHPKMEADYKKYPERIMYGSESFPLKAWESWKLVEKHAYVIGDFVWTGMDYLGESSIGRSWLLNESTGEELPNNNWSFNAWCGDIDIIGNKKPQSYYRDVLWGESKLEILVHVPLPEGYREEVSRWGWPHELKSWNWEGNEGILLNVSVFSTYPSVRLELNGSTIDEKQISKADKGKVSFKVPYEEGTLKAIGIIDDQIQESVILRTAGEVANLNMKAEDYEIAADRNRLIYIQVEARDEKGILHSKAYDELTVKLEGPAELLSSGNASPYVEGSFKDPVFKLFRGKGLIILRSTGEKGEVSVEVHNQKNVSGYQTVTML